MPEILHQNNNQVVIMTDRKNYATIFSKDKIFKYIYLIFAETFILL